MSTRGSAIPARQLQNFRPDTVVDDDAVRPMLLTDTQGRFPRVADAAAFFVRRRRIDVIGHAVGNLLGEFLAAQLAWVEDDENL